ncbi:uncharacterized protein LOC134824979 [Bolinopsis microptera]|uniref:uncharacterized protein LOC134824979 n=1 Tax=Bolinopsis microptera TaxID=2820187 RepID=UPI00307ACC85
MSPKLMKHIYEDVLHSDPNSCEDLINSLTADRQNSLNSVPVPDKSASTESRYIEVDHQALIFGDSVETTATDNPNQPAQQIQPNSDNAPDSLEGFTYNNPQFNEKEFKKTFGILNESYSLATDSNVMVFEENTNVCDEVKLSQLSQQRERMIQDSQPKIVKESPQTSQSSQPHDPLNEAQVFDTVPYKDMTTLEDGGTTVGELVGDLETKLHHPLSSSTQQTKDTLSPRTPNRTLISSSGQSYTSQEFAVMRQQLKENQAELLRLQEIEQAGAAVADTLQPELIVKPVPAESSCEKINETIVEQESFSQCELFEDLVSASNDITICEVEEPTSTSDKTVIYCGGEQKRSCKSRDVAEPRSQTLSQRGGGRLEINTAELIALNEAAIEGAKIRPPPPVMSLGIIQDSEVMTSADIISNTDSVPTQIEGVSGGREECGDQLKVSSLHTPENKKVELLNPEQSNTKKAVISGIVKEVPSLKDNISEVERRSGETAVKQFYIPNIPRPDISNSDSLDSNYVPPSQERSPVIVSRRPSLTVTPVKIVNILLSGMLGKSGSKEAFQLRKSIRGSCHVKFRVLTQYTDAVTHLIFPHNDSMTCPRTAKYFRGIAGGKWILSNQWLIQSYQSKELLHEAPYEMQGDTESGRTCAPRSARIARVLKHPPLFANTSVFYVGDIRILPRDHFSSLLEAVGVTIVHSPDSGSSISQLTYKTQTKVSPLIDSDVTDINTLKEVSGLAPITAQWIVECIAAYKVLPPEDLV